MKRVRLVLKGRQVRDQPPVVGDYCWPGSTGNVDKPCFYASAACSTTCKVHERCGFSFCENHYASHIKGLPPVPPDFWKGLVKRIRGALDTIADHPSAHMPYIEVKPDEARRRD